MGQALKAGGGSTDDKKILERQQRSQRGNVNRLAKSFLRTKNKLAEGGKSTKQSDLLFCANCSLQVLKVY